MSRRKRWSLGVFVCAGIGVGTSGFALLLLTTLDRAVPRESLQALGKPTAVVAQGSMGQGSTIALFLALAVGLIVIALGAGAVEQKKSRQLVPSHRRIVVGRFRTGRTLFHRLQRQVALW